MKLKIEQQRSLSNLYTKLNQAKYTILELCEKYKQLLQQMEGPGGSDPNPKNDTSHLKM